MEAIMRYEFRKEKRFLLPLLILLFFAIVPIEGFTTPFSLISSGANYTEVEFELDDYEMITNNVNDVEYQRIFHPSADPIVEEGLPELPIFSFSLAIPNKGQVSLQQVNVVDKKMINNIKIFPSQGPDLEISETDGFIINEGFYKKNTVYPSSLTLMGQPLIMRDYRYININVLPFRYNPAREELTINTKIRIRVEYDTSITGVNELDNPPLKLSRSFENLYKATFLNYEQFRDYSKEYQRRSILIVHHDTETLVETIDEFHEWKRQKGFEVRRIDTSQYPTRNQIQAYIKHAYDNLENPPEYVIIIGSGNVGGAMTVPFFWQFKDNTDDVTAGDHPYTLLAGNDDISDIFIGRLSVQSADQLATIWNKIKNYERFPYTINSNWYNNAILGSAEQKWGISTLFLSKYVKETMVNYKSDYKFTEVPNPPYDPVNTALNEGSFFLNFRGYYQLQDWRWADTVTTGLKLPFGFFITCHTYYPIGSSRTENFVRAGTASVANGGIAFIGMTADDTRTAFNNSINAAFVEGVFVQNMKTMGEAHVNGKNHLHRVYDVLHPAQAPRFSHWANIVGDPSMDLWVQKPINLTVTYPSSLPSGSNSIVVKVIDENGAPVEDAWVTASKSGDIIFSSDYTDKSGKVTLYFDSTDITGDVNLVVTKPDHKPHLGKFTLKTEKAVTLDSVVWNNEPAAGTTSDFVIIAKNHLVSQVESIVGTISADSEYINITSNTSNFGKIAAGGTKESVDSFAFEILPTTPDGYTFPLLLTLSDGSGAEWESRLEVRVQNANLNVTTYYVNSQEKGYINKGMRIMLHLAVKNSGQSSVNDVYAKLYGHFGAEVVDSTAFLGTIPSGQTKTNESDLFSLDISDRLIPGMTPELQVDFYNNEGFFQTRKFNILVGNRTEDDPLGPDAYGYWVYDSGDTEYPLAPIYDWVEIVPDFGGSGANLGIEADYDNKQEFKSINLPFTFKFYGVEYNRVTICTNGWMSLGETEQGSFRNWRLPGPLGPDAIIAAFWDNLKVNPTSTQGVFTRHDIENNTFIVTWQSTSGYIGVSPNTFQIILYDPAHYVTHTGDGPIKIQYKEFSNTNNQEGKSHQYYGNWGNYCTVGIADHTGTIGSEYTFCNEYPAGARPIENETAIYFTTTAPSKPFVHYESYIIDEGEFNRPTYGQTNDFTLVLKNSGDEIAKNVIAKISTDDPYVTILNDTSTFPYIAPDEEFPSNDKFSITLDSTIPYNQQIHFELEITSELGQRWTQQFFMPVNAPFIGTNTPIIHDPAPGGNNNGIIDPGETVTIYLPLKNYGTVETHDFDIELSSSSPGLEIISVSRNRFKRILSGDTKYIEVVATISETLSENDVLHIAHNIQSGDYTFKENTLLSVGDTAYIRLGSGDLANSASAHCPINLSEKSSRDQIFFKAQEIRNAGYLGNQPITKFGFFVTSPPHYRLPQFLVRMRHTKASNAVDHDPGPFTQVYHTDYYEPFAGNWDMLTLDTPFYWNGIDNLLIDTSFSLSPTFHFSGRIKIYIERDEYRYSQSASIPQTNAVTMETSFNKPQVMLGIDTTTGIKGVATPEDLTTTLKETGVKLSWNEPIAERALRSGGFESIMQSQSSRSSSRSLLGYNIYRNGFKVNENLIEELEYFDENVIEFEDYFYYVTAMYDEGESFPSNISSQYVSFIVDPLSILPDDSIFYDAFTVTITTETENADVYYTLDGSEPTESSTKYTEPFIVDRNITIKAKGYKDGLKDSDTAVAIYYILYTIDNLQIETADNAAMLSWDAPYGSDSNSSLLGYNVYRATDEEGDEPILLNSEPVTETQYDDLKVEPGDYQYHIKAVYEQGESLASETIYVTVMGLSVQDDYQIIKATELLNAYPNPFNPTTTISFTIKEADFVTVEIFNISGRRVKTLAKDNYETGKYNLVWNGENDSGKKLSSGIYFYRMKTSTYQKSKKFIMLK